MKCISAKSRKRVAAPSQICCWAHVMLGQLDLDSFGVSAGLLLLAEQLLGVAHPGQQLVQCVLELAQSQKAALQFVLD